MLYSGSGLTVNDLADCFNVSSTTIYRHLNFLKLDIENVFLHNEIQIIQHGLYFSIEYKVFNLAFIIDSMSFYYIEKSTKFIILEAVLNRKSPSIESLAQEVHMSRSHVYQTIAFFNHLLERFDLKIKFSNPASQITIQGNQVNLRIVIFLSYLNVYKGVNLPFQKAPSLFRDAASPINHHLVSSAQQIRLTQYQTITYNQLIAKKQKIELPDVFFDYLTFFDEVSPTIFPAEIKELFDQSFFSPQDVKNEEAFMGFVLRFFVPNIDSPEEKIAISKKLVASKLRLTVFATSLLDDFIALFHINFTDDEYFSHIYFLTVYVIYYKFIGVDIFSIDNSKQAKTVFSAAEMEPLLALVKEKISPYVWKNDSKQFLITHIVEILFGILKKNRLSQLTIFAQHSKSIYLNDFIKNTLFLTFNANIINFTNDIAAADLIITDVFSEVQEYKQVFYLENPYDLTAWSDLIIFISKRLLLKSYPS